jgi:hypothetical protein
MKQSPPNRDRLHGLAREILEPVLANAGFKRTASGWARSTDIGPETIRLVLSKWNGVGSMSLFTIDIGCGPTVHGNQPTLRFSHRLDRESYDEMRVIRNQITARAAGIPGVPRALLRPDAEPFEEWDDIWMNYMDDEDAMRWLHFVAGRILGVVSRTREFIREHALNEQH